MLNIAYYGSNFKFIELQRVAPLPCGVTYRLPDLGMAAVRQRSASTWMGGSIHSIESA